MRPICVVAACAPHCMYVEYIALRCSAAPSSWATWSPNLSPRPPATPPEPRLQLRPGDRLTPLSQGYWFPRLRPDVLRLRPDEAIVGALLQHVSSPSGRAGHGKGRREIFLRQADRLQDPRRVKLDVGRLRTLRMFLMEDLQRGFLDFRSKLVELGVESRAQLFQDLGARVIRSVDAMAETHESHSFFAG